MGDAGSATGLQGGVPWLTDALEAVGQFGLASIGLVAWELFLTEEVLVPAWRHATSQRLIEAVGRCPFTRERMYRLVDADGPRASDEAGAIQNAQMISFDAKRRARILREPPTGEGTSA
jgi:hypothetical protein